MNTHEIEKTVARDRWLSKIFLGVFPSDMLPEIEKRPVCFIANTDPSDRPGQHWIAMFFNKHVEYFDSYGLKPDKPFTFYEPEIINKYCLQNIGSVVCGEYCIYYLHKRVNGQSLQSIVSELRKRGDSDTIVKLFTDKLRVSELSENCQYCLARK